MSTAAGIAAVSAVMVDLLNNGLFPQAVARFRTKQLRRQDHLEGNESLQPALPGQVNKSVGPLAE